MAYDFYIAVALAFCSAALSLLLSLTMPLYSLDIWKHLSLDNYKQQATRKMCVASYACEEAEYADSLSLWNFNEN